jgi:hypothetical protein
MKTLEELEKAYNELGKKIEALKKQQQYPIYCLNKIFGHIIKFDSLTCGDVVKQSNKINIDIQSYKFTPYTNTDVWQQLLICPITGFYDKQLVWCYNNQHTYQRLLRFYDAKNNCTFGYKGESPSYKFDNYLPYEGNWPQWALDAFETLED